MRFKTLAARRIFSLSSLKTYSWASSAEREELSCSRVTEVPSSVSFCEYLEPFASLKEAALSVNLLKFSKSNKLSSKVSFLSFPTSYFSFTSGMEFSIA